MGILSGKKILITGIISDRSIAYGIAKVCKKEGAELAFTFQGSRFKERVFNFAQEFASDLVFACDVSDDDQIENLFKQLAQSWNSIDGILHSIAYTPKAGLSGDFVNNVERDTFKISNDISAYSFNALAKYGRPLLSNSSNGSLVALSYLGGGRVMKNYNMAGVSKAALEATSRYMAYSLGENNIRVNIVSPGPIKTLAASGITGFNQILNHVANYAPLKRNISSEEVGNTVAYLFSDLATGVTGEVIHVDNGYHIMAASF